MVYCYKLLSVDLKYMWIINGASLYMPYRPIVHSHDSKYNWVIPRNDTISLWPFWVYFIYWVTKIYF